MQLLMEISCYLVIPLRDILRFPDCSSEGLSATLVPTAKTRQRTFLFYCIICALTSGLKVSLYPLYIDKTCFRWIRECRVDRVFKSVAIPNTTIISSLTIQEENFLKPSIDVTNTMKQHSQIIIAASIFIEPNSFHGGKGSWYTFLLLYLQYCTLKY